MPKATVSAVAYAIAEAAKLWQQWLISADKRHMKAAIEAGEKYIQTNENGSIDGKRKAKLLAHYKKRFFKYN